MNPVVRSYERVGITAFVWASHDLPEALIQAAEWIQDHRELDEPWGITVQRDDGPGFWEVCVLLDDPDAAAPPAPVAEEEEPIDAV